MDDLKVWFQGINYSEILPSLLSVAAIVLALSVHESSHALVAYWMGDDTAKRMKRISLNPFRHLDLLGFVMMVVARFGWAKPVPVNMYRFQKPKVGMAVTAAAGPISNVLLALLSGIAYWIVGYLYDQGQWHLSGDIEAVYYVGLFFYLSFILNAGLAVFNLIPISPLDGSKMLAIILSDKFHEKLMRYERYGMFILVFLIYVGVLDGPLHAMRMLLMDGINAIAKPLARWITGV